MNSIPLSSGLTVLVRSVFPAGWAVLLVLALFVPLPGEGLPLPNGLVLRDGDVVFMRWFTSAGLTLLLVEWALWFARLKDVRADAAGLTISHRRGDTRIPWDQVADVRRTWWGKTHFAQLVLRTPARFGSTVLFLMPVDLFSSWEDQVPVRLIRQRMGPASGEPT